MMNFDELRAAERVREIKTDAIAQQKELAAISQKMDSGSAEYGSARVWIAQNHNRVHEALDLMLKDTRADWRTRVYQHIGLEKVAAIAMTTLLEVTVPHGGSHTLAGLLVRLGRNLQDEENTELYRDAFPLDFEDSVEQSRAGRSVMLKHSKARLGQALMSRTSKDLSKLGFWAYVALESCELCSTLKTPRKAARVLLGAGNLSFLEDYLDHDLDRIWNRQESRMLAPPDPWTNSYDGGYLTAHRKARAPLLKLNSVRKELRDTWDQNWTAERMPKVFAAVNYLQSTPFTIHEPTRKAITDLWASGGGVMGVPTTNPPIEPPWPWEGAQRPDTEEGQALFQEWKVKKAKWHTELKEWVQKAREVGGLIKATRDIGKPIWFPMYLDYRGRMYYRGIPNPQGTDLAKGTIHFWEKKPLGKRGVYWLKVHIANSYGYDKARNDDRARWTDEHWNDIERALDCPADAPEVFGDAPWQMFSAAWELREAYRSGDPESYLCGVPCGGDATCSGLQHYSALLRDQAGGPMVNLDNGDGLGNKADIYSGVRDWTVCALRYDYSPVERFQDCPKGITLPSGEIVSEELYGPRRATAMWWLDREITRSMAKKPVMTYSYSATTRSAGEHVFNELVQEFKETGGQFREKGWGFKDSLFLGRYLFRGVETKFPGAAGAMRWLKELVKSCGEVPTSWVTPSGFMVYQDVRKDVVERIDLVALQTRVQVLVQGAVDETDPHGTEMAMAPNVIHSLDASHQVLTIHRMIEQGLAFMGVHDCFYTHCGDMDYMHRVLREEFVQMYSGDFLRQLRDQLNPWFKEPPAQGTLDLAGVLGSEFFFC